jgi:hypothetical protein
MFKPELINEWHPTKNGDLTPYNTTYGSVKNIWWICQKGHEYVSRPNRRSHGSGCPYCDGKKVLKENSLGFLFPDIASEFHHIKNNKTVNDYAGKSNKSVWWVGKCGHEWKAPISNRTDKKSGCPYCTGVKLCKDNSLGFLYPEIAKEWNKDKNEGLTPFNYTSKSERKVWWKCSVCSNEWEALISNRTQNNSGCPMCNESKGEKRIRKWLTDNKIKFESQKEFKGLIGINGGNLSYDFYLPLQDLLIEYQGQFHDGNGNYYVNQSFKRQQEHDKRKKEYAEYKNVRLLEIWYWDFDNIESILENEVEE